MGRPLRSPSSFGQRPRDDLLHRHLALLQMELAGFDARHRDHFRGELIQAVGFFIDYGEQLAVCRRGFAQQVGDGGFDRSQRRLDIVGQRIEEGRFQQLALPRGFGVAGFLHGARLFDGDGGQVRDGPAPSAPKAAAPPAPGCRGSACPGGPGWPPSRRSVLPKRARSRPQLSGRGP